jgi:hypothetical protein
MGEESSELCSIAYRSDFSSRPCIVHFSRNVSNSITSIRSLDLLCKKTNRLPAKPIRNSTRSLRDTEAFCNCAKRKVGTGYHEKDKTKTWMSSCGCTASTETKCNKNSGVLSTGRLRQRRSAAIVFSNTVRSSIPNSRWRYELDDRI